ncbi:HEPN domain-containing protein [Persephonella atlantica]|uniref:HEPN domain-containing protein n=1 Tax=Persephonella atlantica TaxID=2699429 RepID=A0ABS1GKE6_9AQUI|nr:HEPN domain-containing protein [Persephonella atlantica]MBK3333391.1 HEPN domain-containing protein [Persephonella atlantica]
MGWKKNWINKTKEHFEAGKILYEKSLYRDSLARLYYCAYSLMIAECGEAPRGRWEHKGIVKHFFKKLYNENRINLLSEEELELIEDFYEEQRIADYTLENIDKMAVENYISLTKKLFKVVNND